MPANTVALDTELFAYQDNVYTTPPHKVSFFSRIAPTPVFYWKFLTNVYRSSGQARKGKYNAARWSETSHQVLTALESVGVNVEISGVEHLRRLDSPCVIVGNHMSMLETIVLPAIVQPVKDVTFVVKQSLLDYPVFRHILRSRDPIAVTRDNPREDFKSVMQGGTKRLSNGRSIVVFPQTTRSKTFEPENFNTIGAKLALKARVPIVPLALMTDAWSNGKRIKDFGPILPTKKVRFAFGEPIVMSGRGAEQHQQTIDFIESKVRSWHSRSE